MRDAIYSVTALLFSFAILCLGHGLQNTLIGIRATIENYPEWVVGLMTSGYFFGFIIGTSLCIRLIPAIGQIRTFIAFASMASAISLLHVLFVHSIIWIALRVIYGICIAALYVVIESWLNALSTRRTRGKLLSIYMIISFSSLALGQSFVLLAEPTEFVLFAVVSIIISFSLVPLTISRSQPPDNLKNEKFTFTQLFRISPLATIGCFGAGLGAGAFWGLGPVFFTKVGLTSNEIGAAIAATFIGGLIFQWPIGYLSDFWDRRKTIGVILIGTVAICALILFFFETQNAHYSFRSIAYLLIFGGFSYSLYSLFISLANDFLESKHITSASGGLINLHALGAILGPLGASYLMYSSGNKGLFIFLMLVYTALILIALQQIIFGRPIPESTADDFIAFPRTGAAIIDLHSQKKRDEE